MHCLGIVFWCICEWYLESIDVVIDINECEDPNRCAGDEQCVNKQGSFSCLCKGGFEAKDGKCAGELGKYLLELSSKVL